MSEPVLRHVVLFRWNGETSPDDIDAFHDALMTLPSTIPEIVAYRGGSDLSLADGTWDYALVADFTSAADYRTYAAHAEHRAVIDRYVSQMADQVVRVQHAL